MVKVKRVGKALTYRILGTILLLLGIGLTFEELRAPGVQTVVVGMWFFISSAWLKVNLFNQSFGSNEAKVLWMLPVAREIIFSRAVLRTLRASWHVPLNGALACWWVSGDTLAWSFQDLLRFLSGGLAIWLITVSLALVMTHPLALRLRVERLFRLLGVIAWITLPALIVLSGEKFDWLPLHLWLDESATAIAWFYPPAWIVATFANGPVHPGLPTALGAIIIVVTGLWQWIQWPKQPEPAFDFLFHILAEYDEDVGDEETESGYSPQESPKEDDSLAGSSENEAAYLMKQERLQELRHLDGDDLSTGGWIEMAVHRILSKRDRAILPLFIRGRPEWSQTWRRGAWFLFSLVLCLLVVGLLRGVAPGATELFERAHGFGCVIAGACLLIYITPVSGGTSDGVVPWKTGTSIIPMMSGFPVTFAEFLRVSWKIVFIRTLAGLVVTFPLAWLLGWMANWDPWVGVIAASLATRVLLVIVTLRPTLAVYRLGTSMVSTRGGWLFTLTFWTLSAALVAVWCISSCIFIMLSFADTFHQHILWSIVPIAVCLLTSMSVGWLFRWRLSSCSLDYEQKD